MSRLRLGIQSREWLRAKLNHVSGASKLIDYVDFLKCKPGVPPMR